MAAHQAAAQQPNPGPYPYPVPRDDAYNGLWTTCHQNLLVTMQAADAAEEGYQLLFLGDSITEKWRGTSICRPRCTSCAGIPKVFARRFGVGRGWRSFPAGIPGDQSANLLWRLMNGEMPRRNDPKVVVLLIGTNDLAAAWDPANNQTERKILGRCQGR